ncbi:alpha/beta hydrolase fold domain-containing protein [Streptomyces coeruleorubidus]|uniref:alpha/beta hydrolase fold domain-containing protein n=1 Tax=Streptomyces coeruleorubidus TaxID=116188 RepID=UPI0033A395B3
MRLSVPACGSIAECHCSAPAFAARIAVAGTSAGANLAVGAALALAHTPSAPVAQLLACPVLHGDPARPSRTAFAEGYGLTSQAIEWFIGQYLTHPDQRRDPRFAPVLSPDLGTLPPTVLVGAGLDPLPSRTPEAIGPTGSF